MPVYYGLPDGQAGAPVPPITLSLPVPNINLNAPSNGDLVRLRSASAMP